MTNTARSDRLEAAISAIESADDNLPFSKLVEIASREGGFKKARHLRYGDWSDVDFGGSKLDGCDFTGALLIRCRFKGAKICGARFDGARIDIASPYASLNRERTDLRTASDWDAYARGWQRAPDLPPDDHLPVGAIFQDAPFAPEMVVAPAGSFAMGESAEEMVEGPKPYGEAPYPLDDATRPHRRLSRSVKVYGWNEERVELLKKLWADGLSAAQTAVRVGGVTRNAVISKVRRLGLSGRANAAPLNANHLQVTIARPFAAGRFAVTFEEWDWAQAHPDWRKHSGLKPRRPNDWKWGRGRRPAIDVSWDDAQAYCRWLAAVTGKPYRLPSEAEWEYCCRAGTTTAYATGDTITEKQARFRQSEGTVEVGSYPANAWGLHDMHGNVWEWCQDEWHESYDEAPDDGSAWESSAKGGRRLLRGGSWVDGPQYLRSACRFWYTTDDRLDLLGFRVARTLF